MAVFAIVACVRVAAADEQLAKIKIESDPAGAQVAIDGGVQAARTPLTVSLARGRHVVTVTAPDRQPERRAVDAAGAAVTLSFALVRVPPESASGKSGSDAVRKQLLDELIARARTAKVRDPQLAIRSDAVTWTLTGLGFDPTEFALAHDAAAAVADVAGVLKAQTGVRFVVVGHTDDVAFKSDLVRDNTERSIAHAVAVARELIAAGIPAEDVSAEGRGDLDPIAANTSADGKRKNRRIEIVIVSKATAAVTDDKPKAKSLTTEAFTQRMSALADRTHACYKGTLANVAVKLTIAPSGEVTKVVVAPAFAGKPEGDCLAGILKGISFDAWDGSQQTFSYAFLLSD